MRVHLLPHRAECLAPREGHEARFGKPSSTRPGFLLGALGVLAFAAGLLAPWWGRWLGWQPGPELGWLLAFIGLLWLVWVFGWWWRRTWRGAVVTGRNVASLSLLQATAWTVLLVSLLVVVALWSAPGLGGKALDAEGLTRPDNPVEEVGVQVGAVAGTSAAAVGIMAVKKRRPPSDKGLESIAKAEVSRRPRENAGRFAAALCTLAEGDPVRRRQQAELVLGRLAKVGPAAQAVAAAKAALPAPPAGKGVAKPKPADSPAEMVKAALAAMAAEPNGRQEVERFVGDLLQGRVPQAWGAVPGLPPIDETRDLVKRFVQAGAVTEVAGRRDGSVFKNACACQARLTDMLEGDEIADHESKDSSKIQFLLVTLGSLLAMAFWAWHQMDVGAFGDVFLPGLPEGMTVLSTATAAGYLGGKLPQRTPVEGLLN